MKKHTVLFFFTWIFFTLHAGEPVALEELPEFFCLILWTGLWERHKNSDYLPLQSEDSPLVDTTFIPLFQDERQLTKYQHRLCEDSFFPHVILKVKTRELCDPDGIPRRFSKDRFDHYRFNATLIPKKAIVESKIITQKNGPL